MSGPALEAYTGRELPTGVECPLCRTRVEDWREQPAGAWRAQPCQHSLTAWLAVGDKMCRVPAGRVAL